MRLSRLRDHLACTVDDGLLHTVESDTHAKTGRRQAEHRQIARHGKIRGLDGPDLTQSLLARLLERWTVGVAEHTEPLE